MKRVLIVYDAITMGEALVDIASNCEFQVIGQTKNISDAISMYTDLKPDIVIIYITKNDMSEINIIYGIKTIDSNANIVIIASFRNEELVRKALEAGAVSFIIESSEKESILEEINSSIN